MGFKTRSIQIVQAADDERGRIYRWCQSTSDDLQKYDRLSERLLRAGRCGSRCGGLGRIVPLDLAVGQGLLQGGDLGGSDLGFS